MPPRGVKKGTKRARQYEKIKKSQKQQARSESRANEAKKLGIEGRSRMNKSQLQRAVSAKKS